MDHLSTADVVLLAIAGYIAVVTLVRLMLQHREQVARHVREQFQREQARQRQEEQRKAKKEKGEQRKRNQREAQEEQDDQAA